MFRDGFASFARAAALCMLVLAGLGWPAQAGGIAGRITDSATGDPIAGVEVGIAEAQRLVVTAADGRFAFDGVAAGAYDVSFYRLGYQPAKRHIVVAPSAPTGTPAALELDVALEPLEFREEPIVVSATRVQRRESTVPYSNLSRDELDERYTTQDIPVLLSELPSSIYSSDSGNGVGYNYLTLRGFDQRRVSVLVNGVPQNDPEDQNVYWLDFPDLAANLQDVQVQRGAGSAFYGPPAIGGAVNLVTTVFQPTAGVRVQAGGGSYDTQKYSIAMNSGLVGGSYAFYGRYSRLLSDGYRRDSWVDFTSYFLGAARYDETMTTRIHVYGGPIADGLAYYGVPREALGDRDARRQNVLAGGAQIENFSQPHYELLHEWQLDDRKKLFDTFFFVRGQGFFDYDGSWADTTYYRLTEEYGFHPAANPGQSLIRAFVDNKQGGWLPRLDWEHDRGELSVGAEVRIHRSLHWGKIRFAQTLPPELDPERTYYSYRGGKDIFSLYGQEKLRLGPQLGLTGSLQLAYNRYSIDHEDFVGTRFHVPYFFANPRLGFNFNITSRAHAYASYGFVQREPRLKNLYDAAESSGGAIPQFAVLPGGGYDFNDPLVTPEKLHDVELGGGWRNDRLGADINLFWMDFRDEIVKSGQLDRFGQPITGNAARSVHRGVELAVHATPWEPFELTGNVSWSLNQFRDHVVFEDTNGDPVPGGLQLGGNSIAGFPDYIANLRGTARSHGFVGSLAGRYVGPFFTTNYEEVDRTVPPYFVLDADFSYDIGVRPLERTRLRLQVRNLLDRLYVLNGEGDDFFPAATRNFFAGVEFGL